MKKILLSAILLLSLVTFGQKKSNTAAAVVTSTQVDSTQVTKPKYVPYVAVGFSISSGNRFDTNVNAYSFEEASYPSLEVGVTRENVSVGAVFGRGSLKGLADKNDVIGNYYWELKVVPSYPIGAINANLVFGAGSYLSGLNGSTFIEYGGGISYGIGNYTIGATYSNWDGIDYITPSVSYSFN